MAFIETQLLKNVDYGFTGGASFATTRVELFSGRVVRNAERSRPLHVYSAPYNSIEPSDYALVIAAFNACLGGLHSFRFKDKAEYQLITENIGTAVGGAGETMQLIKTYTFGSQSTVRNIVKPVTGTVSLFEDGTPLASSVDTTTGIVTFTSTVGKVITATCDFDVPVMFTDDDLQFNFNNWQSHTGLINLKEDLSA